MDTTYLLFGYWGVGILLGMRSVYLYERLKRHVDKQYPKEAQIVRSHEGQWYPWSIGYRTLRALIEKQRSSDPELAQRAKKADRADMYFLGWFSLTVLVLVSFAIYSVLTRAK